MLSSSQLFAQAIKVIDNKSKNPIEHVAIYSFDHKTTTLTSSEGLADIKGFTENDTLVFQHPSYQELSLTFSQLKSIGFYVALQEKLVPLDEVVISANKWEQKRSEVPNKIVTITAEQIEFENPQTSADMLGYTNQVFIQKSQLGGGSPMIRGFSANSVLIVIDGVRMNNAIYRSGNLQNVISLDPNSMEGVEVIFGPGSVIYGSDALGGVMDFHTKRPYFAGDKKVTVNGNAMARYMSANNERTAHVDINIGLKKWAFLTSISTSYFDDLRMGSTRHDDYLRLEYVKRENGIDEMVKNEDARIQKFSGYDQFFLMQKIRFQPSKDLDFNYGFYYSETSDVPRYDRLIQYKDDVLKYAEWFYGLQKWMMHALTGSILNREGMFTNAKLTLAYQFYEESRNSRKFGLNDMKVQREKVNLYSANFDFNKQLRNAQHLFYGVEIVYNDVNSTAVEKDITDNSESPEGTRYPGGINDYITAAAYLSYKHNFNQKLTAIAGLRYSYVYLHSTIGDSNYYKLPYTEITLKNNALNGSVGLTYRPGKSWQFNLNLSSGFRAPNLDDVAKVFDSEPGNVIVPNRNLKPEYAYNLDLGFIKQFNSKIRLEASFFFTRLIDAMVRRDFTFNGQDSIMYDGELSRVQALVNTSSGTLAGGSILYSMEFAR
ncbi:MAG: TonB-dependent receptor, partial [Bacteroidota bacterium]|nr:TonB-dependent receptor [Bacteroidota bacterium]